MNQVPLTSIRYLWFSVGRKAKSRIISKDTEENPGMAFKRPSVRFCPALPPIIQGFRLKNRDPFSLGGLLSCFSAWADEGEIIGSLLVRGVCLQLVWGAVAFAFLRASLVREDESGDKRQCTE